MTFDEKMTHLRKINGYTQSRFAQLCGVSRQTVYKWESGKALPDIRKAALILKLYNVTLDDLINDDVDIDEDGYSVRNTFSKRKDSADGKQNVDGYSVGNTLSERKERADDTQNVHEEKSRGLLSRLFGKKQ